MARKRAPNHWQFWPDGEAATQAVKLITTRGRFDTFAASYLRKHRPAWIGHDIRAWAIGTDQSETFTLAAK